MVTSYGYSLILMRGCSATCPSLSIRACVLYRQFSHQSFSGCSEMDWTNSAVLYTSTVNQINSFNLMTNNLMFRKEKLPEAFSSKFSHFYSLWESERTIKCVCVCFCVSMCVWVCTHTPCPLLMAAASVCMCGECGWHLWLCVCVCVCVRACACVWRLIVFRDGVKRGDL